MMIRAMELRDAPAVAALEAQNFSEPWSANSFIEEIKKESSIYLVAYEGTDLVGVCGLVASFDEGEVLNVSVKKECRKQGIGLQMLQELLAEGDKRGIKHFTLEVREGNMPARTLYEKLGFVCEGIRPDFYRNPTENAAIYWLHME